MTFDNSFFETAFSSAEIIHLNVVTRNIFTNNHIQRIAKESEDVKSPLGLWKNLDWLVGFCISIKLSDLCV